MCYQILLGPDPMNGKMGVVDYLSQFPEITRHHQMTYTAIQ